MNMSVFVWEWVGKLTGNYHEDGGLVVIARTLDDARAALAGIPVPENCTVYQENPTAIYVGLGGLVQVAPDINMAESRVFVFPDRGCC